MAFMLGDIIIDRVQYAYGERKNKNDTYEACLLMSQISDFTLDITAESKDAVDAQGTLVKRFWQSKSGEVTATNAMINFSSIAAQGGTDAELASATKTIVMPKIATVKAGETLDVTGYVDGTVQCNEMNNSGGMGKAYTNTEWAIATDGGVSTFTPPTVSGISQYIVRYQRTVDSGARIINESNVFPGTIRLVVKALAVDPCSVDTLKACYIEFPSFQISPELSLSLTTDTSVDFSGTIQSDYCGGTEKVLYRIFWADGDEEE